MLDDIALNEFGHSQYCVRWICEDIFVVLLMSLLMLSVITVEFL